MRAFSGPSLLPFFLLVLSCGPSRTPSPEQSSPGPSDEAEALLIHMASLDPFVAGPFVAGISGEARAGLSAMGGLEETEWMVSLLNDTDWWRSDEANTRLLGPNGWNQVLFDARALNPGGGLMTEDQKRAQDALLSSSLVQVFLDDGGAEAKAAHEAATERQRRIRLQKAEERRAEAEEAVRWAQFTEAWALYFQAASSGDRPGNAGEGDAGIALDQAVMMSLARPDFLSRIAAALQESMEG